MTKKYLYLLPTPLFLLSGLPQTIQLLQTQSSGDISVWTYLITWLAVGIIFMDALDSKNWTIAWSNGVSFILLTLNLFLIIYFK